MCRIGLDGRSYDGWREPAALHLFWVWCSGGHLLFWLEMIGFDRGYSSRVRVDAMEPIWF